MPTAETLHIYLLGQFRLVYGDEPVTGVDKARLQALLAYLLLHRDGTQSRQHLAFTFWPNSSEKQARTNLRKHLLYLRRALPDADRFLSAEGTSLGWRHDTPFWLDVADFEVSLRRARQAQEAGNTMEALAAWQQAADRYRGDLLPDCYDDWILPERERLHKAFIQAADQASVLLESQRDYQTAIHYAQHLLQYDPIHEATYRRLMRLQALSGNRAGALQVYHTFTALLERELGVEPNLATRQAYERLLNVQPTATYPSDADVNPFADSPLIGRENEWSVMQQTWEQAAAGHSALVLISGEAGIGKTRLAEELLGWAKRQGLSAASAQCYAAEGSLAYAPVAAWLRSSGLKAALSSLDDMWLTEVTRLVPELLAERPDVARPGLLTEAWQRQRLYEALARAILDGNRPLLLLLDDLQWSDQETLEWLHYLLRFDPASPLLLVATLRLGEVPDNHPVAAFVLELRRSGACTEIELGPLDEAQTATLAAHVAGQAYAPRQAAQLFEETEGNPLFVVESVRAGVDGGSQEPESAEEDVSPDSRPPVSVYPVLPPRVQAMIEARLAQLSPSTRELAGLAATIGRAFTFDVLTQASQEDETALVQGLDELWARRIIREQGADIYDFSHDKLREVIYADLSTARRRLLHRQVAQALETLHAESLDTFSGQVAAHLERAGALYRAFHYYERAAQHAAGVYAHREAARLYAQSIRTARRLNWPGAELGKLYAARGRALEHAGQFAEAVETYRDLETLARGRDDRAMECLAVARLVACYVEPNDVHNLGQAKPLIERGLALARENGEHEQEAHLLWSKMVQATHYGHTEEAQEAGEACIAIARQHGLHARLAYALHDLALNLRLSGKLAQGTAYAAEARRLFRDLGKRPMLADNLAQQALSDYLQLDFDAALQNAAEAGNISQEISNGWNISFATWIQGLVWEARGEWGQAQALWEEATVWGRDVGFLMALTAIPTQLGAMLRELGQIEEAQALHQEAHDASQRLAPFMLRGVESQLALDALSAGEVTECERWLRQAHAREPLGEIGTALLLTYPASAAVGWAEKSGDWDFALAAVEEALEEASRRHLAIHQTHLAYEQGRCLAGLGRAPDAEECFLQVLAKADEAGLRPLQRHIHTALVSLYGAHERPAESETHRAAAAELSQFLSDSLTALNQRRSFLSTPTVRAVLKAQPPEKPALAGS